MKVSHSSRYSARNNEIRDNVRLSPWLAFAIIAVVIGRAHAQETAKVAVAHCKLEMLKHHVETDRHGAAFIENCMTIRGYQYDNQLCANKHYQGYQGNQGDDTCYRPDGNPGMFDRMRRALGF
jgi:hypothetical protein